MFTFSKLVREVLVDTTVCVRWCQEKGILPNEMLCETCGDTMSIDIKSPCLILWKCRDASDRATTAEDIPHDKTKCARENTWFGNSHWGIDKILTITYLFSIGATKYFVLTRETSDGNVLTSKKTISDWMSYCREVCILWVDRNYEIDKLLGGENKVVEVDVVQVPKLKFNRGRFAEGMWIFALIEWKCEGLLRAGSHHLEICPNNETDIDTIIPLIKKHVASGTTVITNLWRTHFGLKGDGSYYFTLDDNKEFIDVTPGPHTNNGSWTHLKKYRLTKYTNDYKYAGHLCEYLFRREMRTQTDDVFLTFVDTIAKEVTL